MAQPGNGPAPYKPLFFLFIAVMGLAIPWYLSYEPVIEDVQQQFRLVVMLLPLLLVLAVKFLSSPQSTSWILPPSDPSSIHRVGGSPWGLGLLLLLILVMIWYQSDILDSWNPLIRS